MYSAILHAHTEHSIKESVIRIPDYIEKAKELGIKELAITDMGTMTGIFEFVDRCNREGIKPIIGLDAYVGTEDNFASIVFLAKNYEGYQDINRALVEGNKHLVTDETKINKAVIPYSAVEKHLGNGNVIMLTSGIRGVLASIILTNKKINAEIDELNGALKKCANPNEEGYQMNLKKIASLDEEIKSLTERENELKKLASKNFKKPLSALESLKASEPELYQTKKVALEREIKESEKAKNELSIVKNDIQELKKLINVVKRKTKAMEKTHGDYYEISEKIAALKAKQIPEGEIDEKLNRSIGYFKRIFKDDLYIEVGYHNNPDEKRVLSKLIKLAKDEDIPIVAANEPYMINKEDIYIRQIMHSLQRNVWEDFGKYEEEYYIKSDEEIADSLNSVLGNETQSAINNISLVADKCNFSFPETKHYPKYIENGTIIKDSAGLLKKKVKEGIVNRGFTKESFTDDYKNRLNTELEVIIGMGFADYLLIVQDFIQYGKKLAKENNEYGLGYGIGPGRGSAAGSLVCYMLGITNIDPLPYNLKFERFLNKERVSMPDIDTDFSAEIRMRCADYVSEKYGRDSVAFIRTSSTQKAKAALKNVTRILSSKYFGDPKHLLSLGNKLANVIPVKETNAKLKNYESEILALQDSGDGKYVKEIYETALKVEGLMTGLGVHAAGVIIGDAKPLSDYVPLLYNNEMNVWAVQSDMVESEEHGLLKMDFLGLKNLDVLSECIRRVKKYTDTTIDLDKIPYEKEVFEQIFSTGNTSSVFQFESAGMKEMLKKFKPSSFEDIILLVAAYRPGPIDFIPKIIESKHGKDKPYYCVPELEKILSPTYGYPIYQEQLMDIFAVCAGFSQGEADIVRRNMSKKKVEKFLEARPKFINGLIEHGASEKDAVELWDSLVSFSEYAFNKSHATAYAQIAYQTAYMKYHYKEYYMCAVLNNADVKKYEALLYECKEMGINILLPNINMSGIDFENTSDGILYGLGKIKSVKNQVLSIIKERDSNGKFASYKDFVTRTGCKKKINQSLIDAGCFDCFRPNMRESYSQAYDIITKNISDREKLNDKIEKERIKLNKSEITDYTRKKTKDIIEKYTEELDGLNMEYNTFSPNVDVSEPEDKLDREHTMLCAYISAHPLDAYREVYKKAQIRLISDFVTTDSKYVGMIKNLRKTKRKSDGAEMAFFDLEDISGTIPVCCFAKEYAKYGNLINEGNVIAVTAWGIEEDGDVEGETAEKLMTKAIEKVKVEKNPIFISVKNRAEEVELYHICVNYEDENGHQVIIHYQNTGEIKRKKMYVKKDVLKALNGKYYGKELFDYKKLDYTQKSPY